MENISGTSCNGHYGGSMKVTIKTLKNHCIGLPEGFDDIFRDDECLELSDTPNIRVETSYDRTSILYSFKSYYEGERFRNVMVPVFVFDGSIDTASIDQTLTDEYYPEHINIRSHNMEFVHPTSFGYRSYIISVDALMFVNKYVFGHHWREYIDMRGENGT